MRKITDGYARQVLKKNFSDIMGDMPYEIPQDMLRLKKSCLHLMRVIRFKRKEHTKTLKQSQIDLAQQVYKEAREFRDIKARYTAS